MNERRGEKSVGDGGRGRKKVAMLNPVFGYKLGTGGAENARAHCSDAMTMGVTGVDVCLHATT